MNITNDMIADVTRHITGLSGKVAALKAEIVETRRRIRSAVRYRNDLDCDRQDGAPMLPLGEPEPPGLQAMREAVDHVQRELDEEEDADDDDGAATHWDSEDGPKPDDAPTAAPKPKRGRKRAEAAGA